MANSGGIGSDSPPAVLEMDLAFEALAHRRRRYLLYTLLEDRMWNLEELAEKITAWEADTARTIRVDDAVEQVYVSLYHNHVPKLVEDEIIEFDEMTETITRGPHAEQVLAVLETAGGSADSQLEAHARTDSHDR